MLFLFQRYVQPSWYFNRLPEGQPGTPVLPGQNEAVYRGLLLGRRWEVPPHETVRDPEANYRFLRRYFHSAWGVYAWILRILSGHWRPRGFRAFRRSFRERRLDLYGNTHQPPPPPALRETPAVSIILPTLNRYDCLKDALKDLERQDYPAFELIVVDQSEPFRPDFYAAFDLPLRLIRQEEKALWQARNTGIRAAKYDLLLFFDDDSRVAADWMRRHVQGLFAFGADLSAGVSVSGLDKELPGPYRLFRPADQLDTGNVLIRRRVFERVGLFDRQFEGQRMGDGEFGFRAFLAGFRSVSNPLASRYHLKAGSGGLRQMGSWDAFRPRKWLAPRPLPSVTYFYRRYLGNDLARWALLKGVLPALLPYRYKRSHWLRLGGALLAIICSPVLAFQLWRSWQAGGHKLAEGPKIDRIEIRTPTQQ